MKQKKNLAVMLTMMMTAMTSSQVFAENLADSLMLQNVVVTGSRGVADVRHLPMTVTVIGRDALTADHQSSVF